MSSVCQLNLVDGDRYCFDMEMPPAIIEKNELKPLWDATNIIIWA